MQNVDVNQAKQHLPQLIEQVIGGDEIVITEDGQPLVKLVAIIERKQRRQFGSAKGLVNISEGFDELLEDFREYM